MTDLELAERARGGDRDAFRLLLERHYDTAYRVALRFSGSAPDAEDIAQDVCLALVTKLASFRGESRFSTWLYRIVVNACRDHLRRQRTTRSLQSSYAVFRELDEADRADTEKRRGWLGEAIAGLEPALRQTAVLVLAEELSHGEAAAALGCAESTVSWRMHEVRKQLKNQMETIDD